MKKKKIKWNIESAKKAFEDGGCKLLTTEYKDCSSKMEFICECGKKAWITLVSFNSGSRCKDCGIKKATNSRRSSIEDLRKIFEKEGCILLSKEYINSKEKLHYICICGNESYITPGNFKSGVRCYNCGLEKQLEKQRVPFDQVVKEFKEIKLISIFKREDYLNKSTPLAHICSLHREKGVQYRTRRSVIAAKDDGCYYCAREKVTDKSRNTTENIIEEFQLYNLTPLSPHEYINNNTNLEFECNSHLGHIQSISLKTLRRSICPCVFCREEKRTSDVNKRIRGTIYQWRKKTEEKCNFKCILTGSKNYDIHHLISYQTIFINVVKSLSLEIKNKFEEYSPLELVLIKQKLVEEHEKLLGVCIHPKIHQVFHSLYGKFNNTPEQFEEFKQRYFSRELDELLDIDKLLDLERGA